MATTNISEIPLKPLSTLSLLSILALSPLAQADFITGQVVDFNGVGIPGINIDVKNLGGGGDPTIFNDGTDVNGFFNTTVPNGLYRVTFTPPQIASSLVLEVDNVVVVGTTAMGVIALPEGIAVSGRFVTELAVPISGINLDAVVVSTGDEVLPLPMDVSDAFGQFTIIVPPEAVDLEIKTNMASGLAPLAIRVDSPTAINLGDITMRPGFLLTAFLRDAGTFLPLSGVDLDVVETLTSNTLFTPGDNSSAGTLDVTIPTGTYDLEFRPNQGSGLAPQVLPAVIFAGALNVGNVDLLPGLQLFGNITDSMGTPLGNVDVDLNDSVTGVSILLTKSDNTNGSGDYSVLAPTGTYTVTFSAAPSAGLADLIIPNVVINSATQLDGMMSIAPPNPFPEFCNGDGGNQMGCTNCPCMNNTPAGTVGGCMNSAGTGARLTASGSTSVSIPTMSTTDLRFGISGAPAGAFCILNSGNGVAPGGVANPCFGMNSGTQAAQFDGLRCAIMSTRRHGGRSADANGNVGVTNNPWGGEGGPPVGIAVAGGGFAAGQTRYFQVINRDDPLASCMRGLNTSQAIEVAFTP